MKCFSVLTLFTAVSLFLNISAAPTPIPQTDAAPPASSYWLASIPRQGTAAYGDAAHKVFRNVKDFGAVGDGKLLPLNGTFKAIAN